METGQGSTGSVDDRSEGDRLRVRDERAILAALGNGGWHRTSELALLIDGDLDAVVDSLNEDRRIPLISKRATPGGDDEYRFNDESTVRF